MLLFALERGSDNGAAAVHGSTPACEDACPVVEAFEHELGGSALPAEKQLARHLNNHLREGLIESGMFELIGEIQPGNTRELSAEDRKKLDLANLRLREWRGEIALSGSERQSLTVALSRLPLSAWLAMPRTLWRLRKKIRARAAS